MPCVVCCMKSTKPLKTINKIMLIIMEKAVIRNRFLFRCKFLLANCPTMPNSILTNMDLLTFAIYSTFVLPVLFIASNGVTRAACFAGPMAERNTLSKPNNPADTRIGTEMTILISFKKPNINKLIL